MVQGALPLGRFNVTTAEVESTFVSAPTWAQSSTRSIIWADWLSLTGDIQAILPVCAAWLGGSFLTSKMDPDDLDVLYIVDSRRMAQVTDEQDLRFVAALSEGHLFRHLLGLRLDTFLLPWVPDPEGRAQAPGFAEYASSRGYWDDLWPRQRSGPKHLPRVPEDALPRRGYLEVNLDGFTA